MMSFYVIIAFAAANSDLEEARKGTTPVLAMFCSKSNTLCADHLVGAFAKVADRRDDVALVALSAYKDRKLASKLGVHQVPAFKWWPVASDQPEPFYFVHYAGDYADTLDTLIDAKLRAHDEL
ncbi:hypothetical protein CTAYLR_009954 [Chrysophaeum taylorii]|uniref:Thioredoxin domain-containing protein n=1 Tax=Chrysophaeum taylorii TaxID=2483200 RepID=A0AAD7UJF4_9STRA|nr:hypothetical protein CTAYLR_009954 [Chrysophaeum taylorii]